MNFRVILDVIKCAKLGVTDEAVKFWDRGDGARYFENWINAYLPFLNVGDFLEVENWTVERDIYVDFNTFVFKIVEKRVRVLGNDKRFLQIKLEPISEDEQRSNN